MNIDKGGPMAALALALIVVSGCGSSSGPRSFVGDGTPSTVTPDSMTPRIDLPGRITVNLRVLNADGTPASGLQGADFNIYENGSLVSQSESFQQIRAEPQAYRSYLHLVLDRSNSVQSTNIGAVRDGAKQFVDLVLDGDEASFIKISWFDGSDEIYPIPGFDLGFTNDAVALNASLDELFSVTPFDTSTNLYGAVQEAVEDLDEIDSVAGGQGVDNRSLSLVLFTDGTHQSGMNNTLQDALDAINGASTDGTSYNSFTIGVGSEIDPGILAALGPDGSVAASEFGALNAAFENIGGQVRSLANSFYSLTYCSPKKSGINALSISVLAVPDPNQDASMMFDAQGFGPGCAFFDVRTAPEVANGSGRLFLTDALELGDGSVMAVGWRTETCTEPGCGTDATAFIAKFRASSAGASAAEAASDGRLDTSFGNGGILDLQDSQFDVSGATCIVQSSTVSGGLVVGGWARASSLNGFSKAVLWDVDGAGATATRTDLPTLGSMGESDQGITSLVSLPDGRYAAGGFYGSTSRTFAVWGVFPNFDLDTAFASGGVFLGPGQASMGNRGVKRLAIGGGGRLYAVGEVSTAVRVVALSTATGQLITEFGANGVADLAGTVDGLSYPATLGDVAIDGSGKLLVGGSIVGAPPHVGTGTHQPALWRVLNTGALDTDFRGSQLAPTFGTGIVTLRTASTDDPEADFGRSTRVRSLAIGPDGTILAAGERLNREAHTDLAIFGFSDTGVSVASYNLVGFAIHDGSVSDKSFEGASVVRVLSSGAIWAMGSAYKTVGTPAAEPAGVRNGSDVPVIWVDRDPTRVFAPLGQ